MYTKKAFSILKIIATYPEKTTAKMCLERTLGLEVNPKKSQKIFKS